SLNMDFVGGTVYGGELTEMITTHDLRDFIEKEDAQKKWLALAGDPEPVPGKDRAWKLTYKEERDGVQERGNRMTENVTAAELRRRAETLPEPTIELIYSTNENVSRGERSRRFTVRTTEKSADLVSGSISRLLGEKLERVNLKDYQIGSVVLLLPEKKAMTLDEARGLVLPALRKANLIAEAKAKDAASLASLRLLPLGGVLAEAARVIDHTDEGGFIGKDEAEKGKGYKSITVTFKPPLDGKKLIDALLPLTKDDRMSVLVDHARLNLTAPAYLSLVKGLLDSQLKELTKQEVNLKSVDETED